jgi:uncharacterized protein (TIGR02391 family)
MYDLSKATPDASLLLGLLSRRARAIDTETDVTTFAVSRLLPKHLLHPQIAEVVWGAFMRGAFDVAVFQAMKGVEVSVRSAAGLGDDVVGVKLMRQAFSPEDGYLTDMTAERGERVGRSYLFAGAIGSYSYPCSRRNVNFNTAHEALEIVLLANHLLRIVDARVLAYTSTKH